MSMVRVFICKLELKVQQKQLKLEKITKINPPTTLTPQILMKFGLHFLTVYL